jgi:hypothetical protein
VAYSSGDLQISEIKSNKRRKRGSSKMSNDVPEGDELYQNFTFLPINHKHAASRGASVNYTQNLRYRINHNRDIRVRKNEAEALNSNSTRFSHRLCFVFVLHIIICNALTSVNCDELDDAVGSRGHFTNTFAVHIPDGEAVAREVAEKHGFHFRGRVSKMIIVFLKSSY